MGRHRNSRKLPPARCSVYYTNASSSQVSKLTSQAGHSTKRHLILEGWKINSHALSSTSEDGHSATKRHVLAGRELNSQASGSTPQAGHSATRRHVLTGHELNSQASSSTSQVGHSASRRPVLWSGWKLNSQNLSSISLLQYQYSSVKWCVSQAQKHKMLSGEKVTEAHSQTGYTQVPSSSSNLHIHNSETSPVSCVSTSGIKTAQPPVRSQIFRGQKQKKQASSSKPKIEGPEYFLDLVARRVKSRKTWRDDVLLMRHDNKLLILLQNAQQRGCIRKKLCVRRCG